MPGMSITNNNPFLLNIQPIQNSVVNATGLDPYTTLRNDVNDIQSMVIFDEKRIATNIISVYNAQKIQVVDDINVSNSILSINDIPVVPGGGSTTNIDSNIINYFGSQFSSVNAGTGVSSLSSITSFGLSSLYQYITTLAAYSNSINPGVSSLSSIVSYGLSSVGGSFALSTVVSYGLSSVNAGPGVSSLSSIVSYGLSSIKAASGQYLGYNTWVAGFYPSSVGGADIYDASTGNPDTYTNAFAKLDVWIYKNIVDQPTAPTYFGQENSISSINYYWKNPDQFKVGILNIYAPYISSLHLNLYSNVSVNPQLFSSFVYSDPYLPYEAFTVEGVEFTNADQTPFSVYSGLSNKTTLRVPLDPNYFNAEDGPYSLDCYFRNYSSNAYKILQFGSNTFLPMGPPGPVGGISYTNISKSNAFVNIVKPIFNSTNPNTVEYPQLKNYRIQLCNINPRPRRYNSPFTQSIINTFVVPYSAPVQSNTLNNLLFPDSTYTTVIAAQNIANPSYGVGTASASFTTPLPTAGASLSQISPDSSVPLFSNAATVFGTVSNINVYNTNTIGSSGFTFTTNAPLAIQTSNNPGSTGTNISMFASIVTGADGSIDSNILFLNGYPVVTTAASNSNIRTVIIASNIGDIYPGDTYQSNFFLGFSGALRLRKNYLAASSNPYTFSLTHSNSGGTVIVQYPENIYIDDLALAPPSLFNLSNTAVPAPSSRLVSLYSSSNHISGVYTVPYIGNFNFNYDINNLARYYYITNQTLLSGNYQYGGTNLLSSNILCNTRIPLYDSNNTLLSNSPLPSITRIRVTANLSNSAIYTAANSNGLRVTSVTSLSNLYGSVTVSSNLPFYSDMPSYNTMLLLTFSNTTGYRYTSDRGPTNNIPSGTYNNTELIVQNSANSNYNFELPLVNGLFRSGGSLSNLYSSFNSFSYPGYDYRIYSNYSNITRETGIRYVTFGINTASDASLYTTSITLSLSNQSGVNLVNSVYDSNSIPYFYYYQTTPTAGWIDANSIRSNITPLQSGISNVAGIRPDCNISISSRTVSLVPFQATLQPTIYVKLGIRMSCNISFQNFTMTTNFNSYPPAPSNVILIYSNSINTLSLRWNTPSLCNPPLDYYTFTFVATCNATYPRRYVASGSRIASESNYTIQIYGVGSVQPSYSYSIQPLNYDTPYYGTVALANDVGLGPYSNSSGTITTNLPSNTVATFASASNLDITNKVFFAVQNGINFAKRIPANNIIYNQPNLVLDSFINGLTSNAFSINNSNTSGPGLSNYKYYARYIQGDGTIVTQTYTFSNPLYAFSNVAGSASASNSQLVLNITKIQDLYSSGLATGFYLKAYVNVIVPSLNSSSNPISFTLSNSDGVSLTTPSYNFDLVPGTASITSIQFDTGTSASPIMICGVQVYNSYSPLSFFAQANNLGTYFMASNSITWSTTRGGSTIANFPFNSLTTPVYFPTKVLNTSGVLGTSNLLNWVLTPGYDIYTPCNIPSFSATASNLTGISAPAFTTVFGDSTVGKNLLIDSYSIVVYNATLNSNWSLTGCNYGARVESGAGTYPTLFGAVFNNTISLSGAYSNELQLSYGAYRTACNAGASNGYLNYNSYLNAGGFDYSGITSTGKRYVTIMWAFNSNTVNWKTANITFQYDNAGFGYDSNNYIFPGLDIYYKIVASNDSSPTQSNYTTAWLNANAIGTIPPSSVTKNTDGYPGSFYYSGVQNDASNLRVFFPALNYSNISFNFYVRVGIPMSSNVSLKYIKLTPATVGVIPGSVTDLTISNAPTLNASGTLSNSVMSWTTAADNVEVNNFSITYSAISNGIYPRRYGAVISDTLTISSNVSVLGAPSNFTYNFTPSNYDTYYRGTVIASNTTGQSFPSSNTSVNSTALPSNTGVGFEGSLRVNGAVTYPSGGYIFANRSAGFIQSNLIYSSNLLFVNGVTQLFITNTDITVNSAQGSLGSNLGLESWAMTLRNVDTGQLLRTRTYTFSNQLYGPSQNINALADGAATWQLSNTRDIYNGDIYRSGFYLATTPYFSFSNSLLTPSSNLYRLTFTDSYLSITNSNNFYLDSLTGSGATGVVNADNAVSFCNISGVSVITSTAFNFWITASNAGRYFFASNAVTAAISGLATPGFVFNPATTPFYFNSNVAATYTSGPISNTTYFYWSNVALVNSNFGISYPLSGSVSNLLGGSALGGSFSPYFDFESAAAMSCNVRITSGTGTYPESANGFGNTYDNTVDLTTNNELQFVRAVFCTVNYPTGSPIGYKNYLANYTTPLPTGSYRPAYTSITTTGTFRYVTVLFGGVGPTSSSNQKLDTVTVRLVYNLDGSPTLNTNYYDTNTSLQVRLNNGTPTTSNNNTAWLDANVSNSVLTINNKNTNGTGCIATTPVRAVSDYAYDTRVIKIPDGTGYINGTNMYVRLGLQNAAVALRRIDFISASNTFVNIGSASSGQLYINSNTGTGSLVNFYINILPNMPTTPYYRLYSYINSNITLLATASNLISNNSNYLFSNFVFSVPTNTFLTGQFAIQNSLGNIVIASNSFPTITSIDYVVARPNTAVISFSPNVWSASSNYIVANITTPLTYPTNNCLVYYTIFNDTGTFSLTGNVNVGTGGSVLFSNVLTPNQHLNRAFFMTTYVQATMTDSSTRVSSNLLAASNGIAAPPSGYSNSTQVVRYDTGLGKTLVQSSNFYSSQIFTFTPCNAYYGFYTSNVAGYPRSIYGYQADTNADFSTPWPLAAPPFTASNYFSVFDTYYNAYLRLDYYDSTVSGIVATSNVIASAKTGLPPDTRSNWSSAAFSLVGSPYPNLGATSLGAPITVYPTNTTSLRVINGCNIAVNPIGTPGNVTGCNYAISITNPAGSLNRIFSNADYSSNTYTLGSSATLVANDYTSNSYARGFYLQFSLAYNYIFTNSSTLPQTNSITFGGTTLTDSRYIDANAGTIILSIDDKQYTSNSVSYAPVSVTDLGSWRFLFANTYVNIKPYRFGNIQFSYSSYTNPTVITTNLVQDSSVITGPNYQTRYNIDNPGVYTIGLNIDGTNTITNYTMTGSFSNLATSTTTTVSDSVFNDTSSPQTGLTLSNGGLAWILGAWRADMSELNFDLGALQGTYGNGNFKVGGGSLLFTTSILYLGTTYNFTLNSTSNAGNIISLTAQFPQYQDLTRNTGYGTFDCFTIVAGIPTSVHDGGCLAARPTQNQFQIYIPYGYEIGDTFYLNIGFSNGSLSNILVTP